MGIMSFHNSTLHCDDCGGESYWVSFHEKSFHKGQRFKLYRGVINGKGPQCGERCVVKVFSDRQGTEALCKDEIRKSEKLRQLVRAFNQRLGRGHPQSLRVTRSYWAQMDEVSKLKQLFFSREGSKKLSIGEAVLFEQDMRLSDYSSKKCKAQTFVDSKGRWFDEAYSSVINAFIHFSYHHSNGELVVGDLNGVKDDAGYFLSTPTIHSLNSDFGRTDEGENGIFEVLNNHECGRMCETLLGDIHDNRPPVTPSIDIEVRRSVPVGNRSSQQSVGQCSVMDVTDAATSPRSFNTVSSQMSEINGNIVEPSAPVMEDELNGNVLSPPPYTPAQEARVAFWIIGDESRNSFVQLPHTSAVLPCGGSVALGSSMECHSAYTEQRPVTNSVAAGSRAPSTAHSRDLNANFTCHNGNEQYPETASVFVDNASSSQAMMADSSDTANNSTVLDCSETVNAGQADDKNKKVRFQEYSLSPSRHPSPSAPSVTAGLSDDITMDTCTNGSQSGSPTFSQRSRYSQSRLDSASCTDSRFSTTDNNVGPPPSVTETDIVTSRPDLPPPYTPTDVYSPPDFAISNWLLGGNGYDYEIHGGFGSPQQMALFHYPADNGIVIRTRAFSYSNVTNNNTDNNNSGNFYI